MPRLSVLLPARNAEATVRRACVSTLRALPSDAELVVLDDGSTDGTAAELALIDDQRLRVIGGSGEGNLGRALNLLLDKTDSELVGRMDADDITLPGRFSSSFRALDEGAEFVFTSAVTTRDRGVRPTVPLPIGDAAFPLHLLLSNPVRHPAMTARRSALDAMGGYRPGPSEDYDLWLRAALRGSSLRKTAWYGLAYRLHPGQISSNADWKEQSHADKDLQDLFSDLSERLLGHPFPRLVLVEGMPAERAAGLCRDFGKRLAVAMQALPAGERAYLQMKWWRRQRQVLRMSNRSSTGGGS